MPRTWTEERAWQSRGYDCLLLRSSHPCGYVRVPEGHPWHGKGYLDTVPGPPANMDERSTDDVPLPMLFAAMIGNDEAVESVRRTPAGIVACHGGLTFAGELRGRDGWWFGFDCGHAGDQCDYGFGPPIPGRYWTTDDVAAETERVVDAVERAASAAKEPR